MRHLAFFVAIEPPFFFGFYGGRPTLVLSVAMWPRLATRCRKKKRERERLSLKTPRHLKLKGRTGVCSEILFLGGGGAYLWKALGRGRSFQGTRHVYAPHYRHAVGDADMETCPAAHAQRVGGNNCVGFQKKRRCLRVLPKLKKSRCLRCVSGRLLRLLGELRDPRLP